MLNHGPRYARNLARVCFPSCFSVGFKGLIGMSTSSKSPTLWQQLLGKDLSRDNKPVSA